MEKQIKIALAGNPNCGAPITALGAKSCAYCGTAVEPLNLRAWVLHAIRKG